MIIDTAKSNLSFNREAQIKRRVHNLNAEALGKKVVIKGNWQRPGEAIIAVQHNDRKLVIYFYKLKDQSFTKTEVLTQVGDFDLILLDYNVVILAVN